MRSSMASSGALRGDDAMQPEAVRQGSEASEIFSLDLSHNLAGLARMQSGLVGAESTGGDEAADLQRLHRLLRPQTDFEVQLLEDVRALKPRCSGEPGSGGGSFSVAALGRALAGQGYLVSVREAQPRECGKACGRACLEKLQHTYIVVSGSLGSAVTAPVVVEAQFREHFQLAHATPAFAQLLAAAPAELVATRARLAQLVELLSSAVAEAFRAQGLPLPPWRKLKSVLSKWGLPPPADAQDGRQGTSVPQHASPNKRQAANPPPAFAAAMRQPLRSRRSCEDPHEAAGLVQVPGLEGVEAMLQGVATAELGRGKRQALEVLRMRNPGGAGHGGAADAAAAAPPPMVVSLSAHAYADMPFQLDGTQLSGVAPAEPHDTRPSRPAAMHPSSRAHVAGGGASPDGSCAIVGHAAAGGKQGREERQKMVSLLAKGLASQRAAEAAEGPPHFNLPAAAAGGHREGGAAGNKPRRTQPNWLLGLPPITTVRRLGRVHADGGGA